MGGKVTLLGLVFAVYFAVAWSYPSGMNSSSYNNGTGQNNDTKNGTDSKYLLCGSINQVVADTKYYFKSWPYGQGYGYRKRSEGKISKRDTAKVEGVDDGGDELLEEPEFMEDSIYLERSRRYAAKNNRANCMISFVRKDNCRLILHFSNFYPGEQSCYKQHVIMTDEDSAYQICGYRSPPREYESMTRTLVLTQFRREGIRLHKYEGYVICHSNLTDPDKDAATYIPAETEMEEEAPYKVNGYAPQYPANMGMGGIKGMGNFYGFPMPGYVNPGLYNRFPGMYDMYHADESTTTTKSTTTGNPGNGNGNGNGNPGNGNGNGNPGNGNGNGNPGNGNGNGNENPGNGNGNGNGNPGNGNGNGNGNPGNGNPGNGDGNGNGNPGNGNGNGNGNPGNGNPGNGNGNGNGNPGNGNGNPGNGNGNGNPGNGNGNGNGNPGNGNGNPTPGQPDSTTTAPVTTTKTGSSTGEVSTTAVPSYNNHDYSSMGFGMGNQGNGKYGGNPGYPGMGGGYNGYGYGVPVYYGPPMLPMGGYYGYAPAGAPYYGSKNTNGRTYGGNYDRYARYQGIGNGNSGGYGLGLELDTESHNVQGAYHGQQQYHGDHGSGSANTGGMHEGPKYTSFDDVYKYQADAVGEEAIPYENPFAGVAKYDQVWPPA